MAPGPRASSCAVRSNGCENAPQTTTGETARGAFLVAHRAWGTFGFSHVFIRGN